MRDKLVLLVEDGKEAQNNNKRMLEDEGYIVEAALTLANAQELLVSRKPNIIVLAINMPDGNGLDFLRKLRQTSQIPVLMLAGHCKSEDIVEGFKSGCDDYLPKPYMFDVLLVRMQRLLQSAERIPERVIKGSLAIDVLSGQAFINGQDLLLTRKEFELLLYFTQNENCCMRADFLYEKVWGRPMNENSQALNTVVSRLRKKLKGCGYTLTAEYGSGYRLERG